MAQIDKTDTLVRRQLVLDKVLSLLTKIARTQQHRQTLRLKRVFWTFRQNSKPRYGRKQNQIVASLVFEKSLLALVRGSRVASCFHRWKHTLSTAKELASHKAELNFKY